MFAQRKDREKRNKTHIDKWILGDLCGVTHGDDIDRAERPWTSRRQCKQSVAGQSIYPQANKDAHTLEMGTITNDSIDKTLNK